MTYVVTDNCILCKTTDCVEVCPVDCFHEGPNFVVINPNECIDCNVCVPECPQEAIFFDEEIPEEFNNFIELNRKLSAQWPVITQIQDPLLNSEQWDGVKDKLQYLEMPQ